MRDLRRLVPRLLRTGLPLLLSGIALSACAHSPTSSTPAPAKEAAAMNTTATTPDDGPARPTYRPHDASEFPDLTPEEMGRRFLKLVDSVKTFDDLTLEQVEQATQLPMEYAPAGKVYSFTLHLPDSGWYYGIDYSNAEPNLPETKGATYRFDNKLDRADMDPVCALDTSYFVAELKKIRFGEGGAIYDEIGRLVNTYFARGDVVVVIAERREADEPNSKLHHSCVESIAIKQGS